MSVRRFYLAARLRAILLFAAICATTVNAAPEKQRLNVVLIAVDDLNTSLHCYGHPQVQTPNVDHLASRGVRFERAYCQYPVCNPSRVSLLTGLRPETTRVLDNRTNFRTKLPDAVTLPESFKRAGYFTAQVGKIEHDGLEDRTLWDVMVKPVATPAGERGKGAVLLEQPGNWCRWLAAEGSDDDQPDGQTVAESIRLIREQRDKPFFIGVGLRRPHDPWVAPKRYFDLYPPESIKLPQVPADSTEVLPIAFSPHNLWGKLSPEQSKQLIRAYYASITYMDAQLGRLIDAIDELKLADRTIIIFFGDHGWHEGDHGGLWLKATLFDQATRVPLIVVAPGRATQSVSPRLVELVDLYPTLAELCELTPPANLEGTSFVPLLDKPDRPWKKAAFTVVSRKQSLGRSITTERYRYTEWPDGSAELYDHESDPNEYHNRASDSASAATMQELKRTLEGGWKGR